MQELDQTWLAIVATPIGNREDITLRAITTLRDADYIFCEDTRVTKKLLDYLEIKTPTKSFHAHSGEKGIQTVVKLLEQGKSCALVTDAGTPGISDPGARLVQSVRNHFKENSNVSITPIPGPDAVSTLISVSGANTQPYTFYGFLPTKKGRQSLLVRALDNLQDSAAIFYESPHRIHKLLQELTLHDHNTPIVIGRELTKLYEEIITDTPSNIEALLKKHPEKQKGEFVVLLPKQNKAKNREL